MGGVAFLRLRDDDHQWRVGRPARGDAGLGGAVGREAGEIGVVEAGLRQPPGVEGGQGGGPCLARAAQPDGRRGGLGHGRWRGGSGGLRCRRGLWRLGRGQPAAGLVLEQAVDSGLSPPGQRGGNRCRERRLGPGGGSDAGSGGGIGWGQGLANLHVCDGARLRSTMGREGLDLSRASNQGESNGCARALPAFAFRQITVTGHMARRAGAERQAGTH